MSNPDWPIGVLTYRDSGTLTIDDSKESPLVAYVIYSIALPRHEKWQTIFTLAKVEEVYYSVLVALVKGEWYSDALLVMDFLTAKFSIEWNLDTLIELDGYKRFIRSREFEQWRKVVGL